MLILSFEFSHAIVTEEMQNTTPEISHIVPVARLEALRALKFSRLESFRALKLYGQSGGF